MGDLIDLREVFEEIRLSNRRIYFDNSKPSLDGLQTEGTSMDFLVATNDHGEVFVNKNEIVAIAAEASGSKIYVKHIIPGVASNNNIASGFMVFLMVKEKPSILKNQL